MRPYGNGWRRIWGSFLCNTSQETVAVPPHSTAECPALDSETSSEWAVNNGSFWLILVILVAGIVSGCQYADNRRFMSRRHAGTASLAVFAVPVCFIAGAGAGLPTDPDCQNPENVAAGLSVAPLASLRGAVVARPADGTTHRSNHAMTCLALHERLFANCIAAFYFSSTATRRFAFRELHRGVLKT